MDKKRKGPTKEQAINFWERYFEYHGDLQKEGEDYNEYHISRSICPHCGHQLRRSDE